MKRQAILICADPVGLDPVGLDLCLLSVCNHTIVSQVQGLPRDLAPTTFVTLRRGKRPDFKGRCDKIIEFFFS
jgi:hypothetical protein